MILKFKNYMYLRYICLLASFLVVGCSNRPDPVYKNSALQIELGKEDNLLPSEPYQEQAFRLWHTIDQFELKKFHFFGEFYDERLKFYYLENPQLQIGESNVNLLMLYFLDDRLVKIRYHLDRNIEEYLLDSIGMGLLKTKYTRKKRVLATEKSLKKLRDFNQSLGDHDEYEISWDRYIILSSYMVDTQSNKRFSFDTISANYIFIDQLKSYSKRLMEIENNRIARLKGDTTLRENLF